MARITHASLLRIASRSGTGGGCDIAWLYTIDDRLIAESQLGIANHNCEQPNVIKQQLVFSP